MKTKFTPGPWKFQKESGKGFEIVGEDYVARIYDWSHPTAGGDANKTLYDRAVANARLIAAAPDLLDDVRWLADALKTETGGLYQAHISKAFNDVYNALGGGLKNPPTVEIWAYQHLRFPHDRNGNPKRLYMVYGKDASLLAVIDEGYSGLPQALRGVPQLPTMEMQSGYREYSKLPAPFTWRGFK